MADAQALARECFHCQRVVCFPKKLDKLFKAVVLAIKSASGSAGPGRDMEHFNSMSFDATANQNPNRKGKGNAADNSQV